MYRKALCLLSKPAKLAVGFGQREFCPIINKSEFTPNKLGPPLRYTYLIKLHKLSTIGNTLQPAINLVLKYPVKGFETLNQTEPSRSSSM